MPGPARKQIKKPRAKRTDEEGRAARIAERARLMDFWREGRSVEEIADLLGWGDSKRARDRVLNIVRNRIRQVGDEEFTEELKARVTDLNLEVVKGMLPGVRNGDAQAANALTKATDQLAKIGGIYAPTKVAPTNAKGDGPPTVRFVIED